LPISDARPATQAKAEPNRQLLSRTQIALAALPNIRNPRLRINLPLSVAAMTSRPSGPASDLDAILESIRNRVAGEVENLPVAPPIGALPPKPAQLVPAPVIENGGASVDALFRAVLEPLLRQWLDAHLPEICERVAEAEIRRLTGKP
jgi:hypothetical protein